MRCKAVQNYCEPYLNGLLHTRLAECIEHHLLQCRECGREYASQREIRSLLHGMPEISRPDDFWASLEHSIRAKISESRNPAAFDEDEFNWSPFFRFRYQLAAVTLIVTLVVSSIIWDAWRHTGEEAFLVKTGGNGEDIDFYLEEHDFAQGSNALSQSAFAGVMFQGSKNAKRNGGK